MSLYNYTYVDPHGVPNPSPMEIDRRPNSLIDIGDFLLGFTIQELAKDVYAPRGRLYDLHTRSWLPDSVPFFDENLESELPVNGKWEIRMIEDTTILCVYSNHSRCRLIYIHVDRQPTDQFPITFSILYTRDIRPSLPYLFEDSFECTVLYSRTDGVESVSVITDDHLNIRGSSVRVFEMNEAGVMVEIGTCNLTNTIDDFVLARSSRGDIVMTNRQRQAVYFDRNACLFSYQGLRPDQAILLYPRLKQHTYHICEYRSFVVDVNGCLWSLDANSLVWNKHGVEPFSHGRIEHISLCYNGRLLVFEEIMRRTVGSLKTTFIMYERWMQPPSLKESARVMLMKSLVLTTKEIQTRMKTHRRGNDATNAFYLSITEE